MSVDKPKYPRKFLKHLKLITNKRAKIVIEHILKHGFITTEELENTYGYNHPPRAVRDVREAGISIITFKVKSKSGKSIAAYKFGDIKTLQINRIAGRISLPKEFKSELFELNQQRCFICQGKFDERYLQLDHRIPYEVGGDINNSRDIADFMLLCGSCNRAKSWSCEHCENWKMIKNSEFCMNCYWGNPTNYTHIALEDVRRLDIQWDGYEVKYYDAIKIIAKHNNLELPDFIKKIIKDKHKLIK